MTLPRRFAPPFLLAVCLIGPSLFAAETVEPVRVGDEVEVLFFSNWYPGVVESYGDGTAKVKYKRGSFEHTSDFALEKMRFPNNEGHWLVWKDASGKFSVEARYISRTKTEVTIRKGDGTEATIPIAALHPSLRKQVSKAPVTSDLTFPVHVGDEIEVKYFSKWYDGTVKSVQGDLATVEYVRSDSRVSTGDFELEDMRFPNGEGHWMIWKDASGAFKVEARYLARTESEVTLLKTDGTELNIPIDRLHASLRKTIAKTTITSELNKIDGAIPIRVGDKVQVKSWSSWYDGTVREVKLGGASVEYKQGTWGMKRENFELKDIRYPNGEGPWREWSDTSGGFKIIARYLARTEDQVTILKEDRTEITVPIDKLSTKLKKILRETPVIARRPPVASLANASLLGDVFDKDLSPAERAREMHSRIRSSQSPSAAAPDLSTLQLSSGAPVSQQTIKLPQGRAAFAIHTQNTIDKVVPVGGSDGWVAISTRDDYWEDDQLTSLHWAALGQRKAYAGPQFFPDQRMLTYSSQQQRAVMYSVKGTWDEPYQLSTYRISPGERSARSEITLDIPKKKHSFNREPIRGELIGDRQMLFGYGGKVSLWDLVERRILYEVGNVRSHFFRLSIDHQYFAVLSDRTTMALHETATGKRIGQATWDGYGSVSSCFSDDGKRLTVATSSGFHRWDLSGDRALTSLPIGGIGVSDNMAFADVKGGWLVAGPQIYSSGLGLIAWRYDGSGVSIKHQQMLGRQMLVAATAGGSKGKSVLVGVATVPHDNAIEIMKTVDPESLRMLVRGSRIRIDSSVDQRIVAGLRRAAQQNGWIDDPGSEVILTGSAKQGKSQKLTYRTIGFGSGGNGEETHTVSPWIQTAEVVYKDQRAWSTGMGGVPYSVQLREGQSLGGELQKSSSPSYALFENLKVPEEIIYPRYQKGLGQTLVTSNGFVDKAK